MRLQGRGHVTRAVYADLGAREKLSFLQERSSFLKNHNLCFYSRVSLEARGQRGGLDVGYRIKLEEAPAGSLVLKRVLLPRAAPRLESRRSSVLSALCVLVIPTERRK